MKKCIPILGLSMLFTWTALAEEAPKYEVFLGYHFVRFNPNSGFIPSFNANGGGGQFVYNFNKWLGAELDAGAVTKGELGGFNVDSTVMNFVAGPRVTFHNKSRFIPFVHALFGGAYSTASVPIAGTILPPTVFVPPNLPVSARLNASFTGFAMLAGGGLDIKLSRHIAFRPIGADYYLMRLPGLLTGNQTNRNNFRYSGGVTFMFGGESPTPPPPPAPKVTTKTCPDGTTVASGAPCPKHTLALSLSSNMSEMCQGETAQINYSLAGGQANGLNYAWTINGQPAGQGQALVFSTAGKDPGTYNIGLNVNGATVNPASAATTIVVKEYQPPTGTVEANPAQINSGDKSSLSASFHGQCGGPIQAPTFEASEGSVRGDQFDSTGVQFDPASKTDQRKSVTITAKAADSKSVGTATTNIDVLKKAEIAAIRLPDVMFSQNDARVNNCGKRILLEQLPAYTARDGSGTVVLLGQHSSDETAANLDEHRALNAAAVITAGSGVCLSIPKSQVQLGWSGADQSGVNFESGFCSSSVRAGSSTAAEMRRVSVWFVPSGGQVPASVTKHQDAASLPVEALGCPK
jgi:Outer membrane protein beta-barrel domain